MFDTVYDFTHSFEGGYVNDPADPGGATNQGVTQNTYDTFRRLWHLPLRSVKQINNSEVRLIYEAYWRDCMANTISITHPLTAAMHFDTAFNCGDFQAAKLLQRALGVTADGHIGPLTLAALSSKLDTTLLDVYKNERIKFYNALVTKRPQLKKFLKGWLQRTEKLCQLLLENAKTS